MTLVDRFICRREGHIPAFQITKTTFAITSYLTSCKRCGKVFEMKLDEKRTPP